ncbi:MAG: hypothetical protein AB2598_02840 [Candidatus Thiodiazotropha sp.]
MAIISTAPWPAKLLVLTVLNLVLTACERQGATESDPALPEPVGKQAMEIGITERRHAQAVSVNYPETGVDVGWGWDSEEGVPQPNVCIEYAIEEDMGQTKYMTMTEVSDSRELMRSMNVSAAASVKTIAYKASGSAKFAKNTKINSFSSNFVLNVSVDNGVRYATPLLPGSRGGIKDPETRKTLPDAGSIRLTSEALRLATKRDLTPFLNLCGDSYVAALYGGARLTAVISVATSSKQEKTQASTSFSGSGWGVSVKASAKGESVDGISNERISMRFYQSGGRKDKIPATKGDLLAKLDSLTTEASDYPAYYRLTLMPYTALANWPDRSIPLDFTEAEQLADYWAGYRTLYEDLEYIFGQPGKFQVIDGSGQLVPLVNEDGAIDRLETVQDQVQAILVRLQEDALRCSMPEEACDFSQELYLSPYAFRIQMPLPVEITEANKTCPCADAEAKGEMEENSASLVDYYIRTPVKSRCLNNPVEPGCLSNAQIDRWERRVGKVLVELPDGNTAVRLLNLIAKAGEESYEWLDVIERPAYAWLDPGELTEDQKPLDRLLALLK